MLAVATNTPRIVFMSDEGALVPNFEITRGKNQITQLKWHPVIHALAIGWSDGCITLWQEDDRLIRDEKVSYTGSFVTSLIYGVTHIFHPFTFPFAMIIQI